PARSLHALAYDAQRRRTVLFGGGGLSDTWEWDGNAWLQRLPARSPSGRDGHAMTYDSALGQVVLCGGSPPGPSAQPVQTWNYAAAVPALVTSFGTGCGSPPALGSYQGSLPWLGDTFSALFSSIGPSPVQNVPFVVLGDSKSAWGAFPLPLDLAVVGMPGC